MEREKGTSSSAIHILVCSMQCLKIAEIFSEKHKLADIVSVRNSIRWSGNQTFKFLFHSRGTRILLMDHFCICDSRSSFLMQ